jgi:hypothetical protein
VSPSRNPLEFEVIEVVDGFAVTRRRALFPSTQLYWNQPEQDWYGMLRYASSFTREEAEALCLALKLADA